MSDVVDAASTADPLRDPLVQGASSLGLALTADQTSKLLAYLSLIERWNRVYNLTAVRSRIDMLTHHLLDSLSMLAPLDRVLSGRRRDGRMERLLDVGSGAGLPGVVLAIMNPPLQVTCVDAVAKKAGFIRQAGAELGLPNLVALHARVESLKGVCFDIITSRALGSLADLVTLTAPLLAADGVWAAMKGQEPTVEVAALPASVQVFHVEHLAVPGLNAQRCLVWMRMAGEPNGP